MAKVIKNAANTQVHTETQKKHLVSQALGSHKRSLHGGHQLVIVLH